MLVRFFHFLKRCATIILCGQLFVTTLEGVVNYFKIISKKLLKGEEVTNEFEYECTKANGQIFIDSEGGLGHK